jgi:hypothetical protein
MTIERAHAHPQTWPFADPPETEVTTTRQVLEGCPVLLVNHGREGKWLFHCATTEDLADKRTACFGCLAGEHPEILELGDLPAGRHANRSTAQDPWEREQPRGPKEILEEAVAARGWQTVLLPSQRPIWGFTVGLGRTFAHPEAFVIGLPPQVMFDMLENIAKNVSEGHRFEPGVRTDRIIEELSCELRPVDATWHEVLLDPLRAFYEAEPFSVLQCLWPDKEGKLPHDEGYDEATYRIRQPLLEHADPERAGMVPLLVAMGRARSV